MNYEQRYREAINKYIGCGEDHLFFYWKGRVALYALLKAMGVGEGDEVIVQGYTCVVVANAIIYLGAKPIYADIDINTFNMNIDSLKSKITERTKVIICQNTYGLSSNLEIIEEIAKEMGYTVQAVYKWYYGKGLPSLESAYVLSKVLDVSMESLLVPIIKKPP